MCNLYSMTRNQDAIRAIARAMRDQTGNLPPMPGIFSDYPAPIVRNAPDEIERWMTAPANEALALQRPLPNGVLRIVARGTKQDS